MNWTKVSAIAEIVSSVAILATLVYLGIQTRHLATQTQQNTAAIISNSRQQSLDSELRLFRMMMDYPVAELYQEQATGDDGIRQRMVDFTLFRIREHQWFQHQDGQLDPGTWQSYLEVLVSQIRNNERLRQRWNQVTRERLDPDFVAQVNERLTE